MSSALMQFMFLALAVLASGTCMVGLWYWSHGKTRTGAALIVMGQVALFGLLYLAWRLLLPDGPPPVGHHLG
jgi:hypothetical protein